jgi:phage terminase small subunit
MPARRTSNRSRQLRGTYKPSQPTAEIPEAPGALGLPSRHLPERQKWIWRQALADAPPELLRRFDRNTMTAYVSAVDRVREANRLLPTLVMAADIQACRRELNDATRLLVMVGKELGMSPLARGRITMPETAEKVEEENPWQGALRLVPKPS